VTLKCFSLPAISLSIALVFVGCGIRPSFDDASARAALNSLCEPMAASDVILFYQAPSMDREGVSELWILLTVAPPRFLDDSAPRKPGTVSVKSLVLFASTLGVPKQQLSLPQEELGVYLESKSPRWTSRMRYGKIESGYLCIVERFLEVD
jgi:hypothetical protein